MPVVSKTFRGVDPNSLFVMKCIFHITMMVIATLNSGLMMYYYTKSMQLNGAAKATVYNFAINYLGSIVLGHVFFGE